MARIAMDEAGNTGENLFDPSQPVFALASIAVEDTDARSYVDSIGNSGPVGELHFNRLRKSRRGRQLVLRLLEGFKDSVEVKLSLSHKPYSALGNLVDLLVEPLMQEAGYDLYAHGNNVAFVDYDWWALNSLCGEEPTVSLLSAFVRAVRSRTPESVEAFNEAFLAARSTCPKSSQVLIFGFPLQDQRVVSSHVTSAAPFHLDPAVSNFILHCELWGRETDGTIDISHDRSKVLAHQSDLFRRVTDRDAEPIVAGYGDRAIRFPLPVSSLEFVDSADSPSVQLADIVASSAAFAAYQRVQGRSDEFGEALGDYIGEWGVNVVWPGPPTPLVGGSDLTGRNPADAMAEFLNRAEPNRGLDITGDQ